ncbi:ADP-glyceromanno-heptose 6-epimerase [Candidatus Methylacidiphilum fumarolicum]|uniref:Nucleoside-diphosphate-sugar epimerase n=2 Tax=Candidatus Methylacidiphilum fumarolicum TaxID=591154 RepID=I0K095_METFB|nr:ADP-glyceromanno-heptose 6-epimerase [Candidatus Methylacidiphilum fumarolicum]MBW6415106.1 ADP-glyceromanno-heptose 6-epimerase [Candidatus Methylacidiphilum fumarolicum]TFE67020.1 ADP-glyceromanno-heptose 6-epimerase [Candidatus Methylacidiphilum fumarolicum]TFE72162.1 ADP-glyceromanno-heptose 6-epimerase [Candidatus Methylacidiphilum fumarolicum]TFE72318.1 ADP-glyceromanno-heptose 6-epimerase [Candidatus Methylacidiphilum fumarolicum]TFE76276.1 ADP-glyceromanno-heptose 6-epimerase [Candi
MWKKILVTGGAGFIGSNLVHEIQRRFPKSDLIVIDDFSSGSFKNMLSSHCDVITEDLYGFQWENYFSKNEIPLVFHLASLTDTTVVDERRQMQNNVEAFRKLLRFFSGTSTRIIYASSAAVYGIASGRNSIHDQPHPANPYGFSKLQMEHLAAAYSKENPQARITGLRYFNVYGPRETHKGKASSMILQIAKQIKEGKAPRLFSFGEQKRDFVYVADVVNATILTAIKDCPVAVLNVGSGCAKSFNEVIQILNQILKTEAKAEYFPCPYPFYQVHTEADLLETQYHLGYIPEYSLERGIEAYFQSGWLF